MDFMTKGYEELELSTQIIVKEALERKVKVDIIDAKDNFIRLQKGLNVEYIKQATRTSADTYISALIMENKFVTKQILREHNIRVPEGKIYHDIKAALKDYDYFREQEIVVKPNNTNFGIGVNILKDKYKKKNYHDAVNYAFEYDRSVLIEEYIEGKEYRFLVIGDKVIGILYRMPANVIGDGINSIKDLVKEKNKDPLRGKGYKTPLEKINLGDYEIGFLKNQSAAIDDIPEKDKIIFLRNNSNISTGGDSIDFTDDIGDEYKNIAIKSAEAAGAKICGVDLIINDINKKPGKTNHAVIELNFNPALHIHAFPYKGINRSPEKYILDLLGFNPIFPQVFINKTNVSILQ